jgi:predicted nucleic acid-binding protein
MKQLRIYVDTSVIGGCLDEEFAAESRALLRMAHEGSIVLLVSDLLAGELDSAPAPVRDLFGQLPSHVLEMVSRSAETERLRDAYIRAGVVGRQRGNDALHVALATVAGADMVVSWNFRHMVHFDKIRGFNAVNLREGYKPIEIHSPNEVV